MTTTPRDSTFSQAVLRRDPWCCAAFQGRFITSTERGFSIVLADPPQIGFVLLHRSVDAADVPGLVTEVPVALLSETGIDYCPWCGERLVTFYKPLVFAQIKRAREE